MLDVALAVASLQPSFLRPSLPPHLGVVHNGLGFKDRSLALADHSLHLFHQRRWLFRPQGRIFVVVFVGGGRIIIRVQVLDVNGGLGGAVG